MPRPAGISKNKSFKTNHVLASDQRHERVAALPQTCKNCCFQLLLDFQSKKCKKTLIIKLKI
jgi:hypothetical protein